MEMKMYDDKKYVSIWLTRSESRDAAVQEGLKPIYQQYKAKKYRVVVFESGDGNLPSLTKDLLSYHQLLAQRGKIASRE